MAWYKDKVLWVIIGTVGVLKALLLCYLYFFHPAGEQALLFPDSLSYVYPAQTLLTYGHFWETLSSAPMLMRTPGYPLFIAVVEFFSRNATWAIVITQNVLSLVLVIPVYLITRSLANLTAARLAAACCATSFLYTALANAVLAETVGTFLLAWFVYAVLQILRNPSPKKLLTAALLLAAAIYTRPSCYLLGVITVGFFCFYKSLRKSAIIYFLLPLAFCLGAWHVRNYAQTGFSGFTTSTYYTLYHYQFDYIVHSRHIPPEQAQQLLEKMLPEQFDTWPPAYKNRFYKQNARTLLRQSFLYRLQHAPWWAVRILLGPNQQHWRQLIANETIAKGLVALSAFQIMLLVLLGGYGCWVIGKQNFSAGLFLLLYSLFFWATSAWFASAYARFRAPFEFVLCITAGIAAERILSLQSHRKTIH